MRKLLKNVSTTDYIHIKSVGLILGPEQIYEVSGTEKLEWVYDVELLSNIRNGKLQVGSWEDSFYSSAIDGEVWFRTEFDETALIIDGTSITEYSGGIVTDAVTSKKTTSLFMDILTLMKELYNSTDNPIYSASFQKFIGTGGREQEHLARTNNLEVIHGKTGWHEREIVTGSYIGPQNMLIYYGWLNSFNSATNVWNNELVAQEMSKYNIILIGDTLEDPSHGDYANTQIIIARIKALNPNAKIFGYVAVFQSLADFQTKTDQWNTLQVHGIMMDESGYDYGTVQTNGREAFNAKIDYVHGKTYANLCFVNAWNMDHIIGTTNDPSYPNSTWNPSLVASNMTSNDWYLLESFPVNTTAYSGNAGYESKVDWLYRGQLAMVHRNTYGINLAACGIIDDANTNGQALFDFLYISSLMWCLEACGSSDTSYGSGTANTKYWNRKNTTDLGKIWRNSPACVADVIDNDVYWRYTEFAKLKLDFSSGAQLSSITRFFNNNNELDGITLLETPSVPASPSSGLILFDKKVAGRNLLSNINSIGPFVTYQPSIFRNQIGCWSPIGNATTAPIADGIATPSATGTATARNIATTNLFTSLKRLGYVTSSTTAGSSTGARLATLQYWRGNASGLGGFFLVIRFGVSDAATVANSRMFIGLQASTSVIGNVEPTSLANIVGVGCNAGVTTLSIIYNDGSGTASTISLGANFPSQTLSVDVYDLTLYCTPNSSIINYRVDRVNTGHFAEGVLTTDLPVNTQLLAPQLWRNNGSTALAVAIDLMSLYIETNN